jgi:tetratricopeptide (TPR) repeat protein
MPTTWSDPWVYGAILIYGVLGYFAIKGLRSKAIWSFAILFFLLTIAPISNFFFDYVVTFAERAMYTPSFGMILLVSAVLYSVFVYFKTKPAFQRGKTFKYLSYGFMLLCIGTMAVVSASRNLVWKDDLTLFSKDVQTHPNSVRLNMNYAQELINRNTSPNPVPMNAELEQAKSSVDRVMTLIPDLAMGHLLNGNLYKVTGQYKSAETQYLRAQELDPNNPAVYFNLGLIAQLREDLELARTHYLKSLELFPNHHGALSNLGVIYGRLNEIDKCIDTLEKAFTLKPDAIGAGNLEQAYTIKGNTVKAAYYRDLLSRLER